MWELLGLASVVVRSLCREKREMEAAKGIWRRIDRGELREKRMVYREEGEGEVEMSREMG